VTTSLLQATETLLVGPAPVPALAPSVLRLLATG